LKGTPGLPRFRLGRFRLARCLLALMLLAPAATAHELQNNRATLVLHDQTHVSITLYLAYTDALHQALAPQRSISEFLVAYSAMNLDQLQRELARAQAGFQGGMKLYLANGTELTLTNWVWPTAREVQIAMQQRMMLALVDPNGHAHDQPVEIHADAVSKAPITSIRVSFPQEFGPVLVVSYKPRQVWVAPKLWSPEIVF
jgi:hypothetical protein